MRERHEDARLSAFLDDELDEREALEVTRHLARCPRCLDELEGLRRTRSALRELPGVEPPADLFDGLALAAPPARPRWFVTAVVAGIAVGLSMYLAGDDRDPLSPLDRSIVEPVGTTSVEPAVTTVDLGP